MISLAKEYIKWLCEREQGLFPEPLKESVLTETDILEIERGLGYALPEQYREFLQSWQLPEWAFTVYVTFCGDYPNCFWKTYSREKGGYIPSEFGDTVTVELVWQLWELCCGLSGAFETSGGRDDSVAGSGIYSAWRVLYGGLFFVL